MIDWGEIGIKDRRTGRGDFLSMGGVWNTYGAGAENGIVKNCKIPPRQDCPAGQYQKITPYVKKLIFFTFDFYYFLDIMNIDFFVNSNSFMWNISNMFLGSQKIYIAVQSCQNAGVMIWKRYHIQDQKSCHRYRDIKKSVK